MDTGTLWRRQEYLRAIYFAVLRSGGMLWQCMKPDRFAKIICQLVFIFFALLGVVAFFFLVFMFEVMACGGKGNPYCFMR
jgi:hypothetical protein